MYEIMPLRGEHIAGALRLWHEAFLRNLVGVFPDFFPGGASAAESMLRAFVAAGRALAAVENGELAGYMGWTYFDFHGEPSAFCPTVAHAARAGDTAAVYRALYTSAARAWVADGKRNHLWMMLYGDDTLKNELYELGFAAHVVNACARAERAEAGRACPCRISQAGEGDARALLSLADEAQAYFLGAPLFLRRQAFNLERIHKILKEDRVLMAWDGERPVGALNFTVAPGIDCEQLTGELSACVTGVGAYVASGYRGAGIGGALVERMLELCLECGRPWVHVCYESANPFASAFWPRRFTPAICSVRRTVNKDMP